MRYAARVVQLASAGLALLLASEVRGLDRCRVSVDKSDGTLLVSATDAAGPVLWGPTAATATRPFANAASCLVGERAQRCVLGDPGSAERITAPPLCTLHLSDGVEACSAYLRGCTPGSREFQKRVFVTSAYFSSNLGGVAGADASCQAIADGAGLVGDFRAWLSDATQSPASHFVHSSVPYVRLDGAVVADNWPDLTDGTLQNPINVNENLAVSNELVWTNTTPAGTVSATNPAFTCLHWNSTVLGPTAQVGISASTTSGWSSGGVSPSECGNPGRALYCFEQ